MSECWSARRVEERRGTIGDGLPGYMRVASPLDGVGSQNYHKLFLKSTLFYFFLKSQSHPTPRHAHLSR